MASIQDLTNQNTAIKAAVSDLGLRVSEETVQINAKIAALEAAVKAGGTVDPAVQAGIDAAVVDLKATADTLASIGAAVSAIVPDSVTTPVELPPV